MSDKVNWDDFTPVEGAAQTSQAPVDWSQFEEVKPSGALRDLGKSLKVGVQKLPGMVTGLADLPIALATGARPFTSAADAVGEATGFQPGKWADETQRSDDYKAGQANVNKAWAGVDAVQKDESASKLDYAKKLLADAPEIAGEYLKNPMYTANQVVESVPGMIAGGAASKLAKGLGALAGKGISAEAAAAGAMGPVRNALPGYVERVVGDKWVNPVVAGMGEGAVAAGSAMDSSKGEDQQKNAIAALGAGVGTGLIGTGAGRLANKLGLETSSTAMAKLGDGTLGNGLGATKRILGGAISEAAFQELPQSIQEAMWQNYADGKPIMEGVARQGVEGALSGVVMGGGANVFNSDKQATPPPEQPPAAVPPLQLGNTPDPYISFPDGTVARRSEVEAYVNSLPADQQPAARAKMMGLAPQPAVDQRENAATTAPPITADTNATSAINSSDMAAPGVVNALSVKPSEAMGLDPAAGPMSAAATIAVDTGVHQQHLDQQTSEADQAAYDQYIAQQDEDARQQDTADKPLTHGALAEAAMSEDDKRAVLFSNKAVADGGTRYKGTQDGDILNGAGAPFTNYLSAGRRASMEGKDWTIAKIGEKQFVARRKDANGPSAGVSTVSAGADRGGVAEPAVAPINSAKNQAGLGAVRQTIPRGQQTVQPERDTQAVQPLQPDPTPRPEVGHDQSSAGKRVSTFDKSQTSFANDTSTSQNVKNNTPAASAPQEAEQHEPVASGRRVTYFQPPTEKHKKGIRYSGTVTNQGGKQVVVLDKGSPSFAGGQREIPYREKGGWESATSSEQKQPLAPADTAPAAIEPIATTQGKDNGTQTTQAKQTGAQPAQAAAARAGQAAPVAAPNTGEAQAQTGIRRGSQSPTNQTPQESAKYDRWMQVIDSIEDGAVYTDSISGDTYTARVTEQGIDKRGKQRGKSVSLLDGNGVPAFNLASNGEAGKDAGYFGASIEGLNGPAWTLETKGNAERDGKAQPVGAQAAPAGSTQGETQTPDQRRRARLEQEIASGTTNNGGVVASLRPFAIEKRKQELAAMGERGRMPDAPGKAPRATPEQLTAAQDRWQRMTTTERQAVAARTDVKPVIRKNLHTAQWGNLNIDVQRKLQRAMAPQEAQPSNATAPADTKPEATKSVANTDRTLPPKLSAKLQEAHKASGVGVTFATVQRAYDRTVKEVLTGEGSNGGVKFKIKPTAMAELKSKLRRLEHDLSLFGIQPEEKPSAETAKAIQSPSQPEARPAANTAQPATGDGVAAEAKDKRVKPKAAGLRAKMEAARQARADYFTPGNIVTTYGGHDEVLSYTPPKEDGSGWNVRVQEVKKVDGQWVRQGKPQDARVHATQPDARALAAGPVERVAAQPAAEVVYSEPRADGKPFPNAVDRGVAPVEEKAPDPAKSKIADFGEKIGGAKKDTWTGFKDDLGAVSDDEIAGRKLSEIWPNPDYQKMVDDGMNAKSVAVIRALRDEIPAKPRAPYKVKRWAEQVKTMRDLAANIMDGKDTGDGIADQLERGTSQMRGIAGRVALYEAVGHDKSLEGIRLAQHHYSLYRGRENVTLWVAERDAGATAFSNWPQELATGDTKADAIAAFKARYAELDGIAAVKKADYAIFTKDGESKFFVGKKIGRNVAELAGPFDSVKDAREYRAKNQADLDVKLAKYKEIPQERRDTNEPRVGEDMRNGQDVTPEMFGDAFGFKGVEFGNWVEQKRRQKDLNNAFDALMDMAAIMGVPAKAISLNGELGLAFGARGSGGVNPAAAHYESDKIVINLTKREGAGSLGHEWWHALDNYFSRMRGSRTSPYMTTATDVDLSARGSNYVAYPGVRKEMIDAFGEVVRSIKNTAIKARSSKMDAKRTKEYWTTGEEMAARAFESYLISKLHDQNASNDYLANVVDQKTWDAMAALGMENEDSYPYPTAGEMPVIRSGFDKFFQILETKETDKGTAMFSRAPHNTPSTVAQVQQAIRQLIGITGRNQLGHTVATTAAEIKSTWEPLTGKSVNIESEGDAGRAQAYYDPKTKTVFLIADHIRAGDEAAVLTHELMHKHGQAVLGKAGWDKLHDVIGTWKNADKESDERLIYDSAAAKVRAVGERLSNQELFPYAVEAAMKAGIKPNAMARQGSVQKWLAGVIQSMKDVWAKVTGKPDAFKVQDMVDLAFGIAQMENPDLQAVGDFRDTNEAVTKSNDVVGNQSGRSADDTTPGASFDAQVAFEKYGGVGDIDESTDITAKSKAFADMAQAEGYQVAGRGDKYVTITKSFGKDADGYDKKAIVKVRISDHSNVNRGNHFGDRDINIAPDDGYIRDTFGDALRKIKSAYVNDDLDTVIPNESTAPDSGGEPIAQTDTPAFRKWFGDSKVVDADGEPLVVYHGTGGDFSVFQAGRTNAMYFTADAGYAGMYAKKRLAGGDADRNSGNVMPVYLALSNPLIVEKTDGRSAALQTAYFSKEKVEVLRGQGYDGVINQDSGEYIVFDPEQIKSATGNNGQFDPKSVDIRYSMGEALTTAANSVRDVSASTGIGRIANKAVDVLNDRLSYEGTVGIWHKTFGSMFQLAKSHPPFQKVFNAAQDFINDVAYYASEASDLAPKLLPKLEDWKDIGKQPISSADNQAIQAPIFEGTLSWARDESGKPVKMSDLEEAAAKLTTEQKAQRLLRGDHISENVLKMWQGLPIEQFEKNIESKYERDMLRPGVVWTPAELKSMFNLTGVKQANGAYDGQIGLYQEFRNAIDNSLDNTAKVDMLRYAGEPAADLREMILDAPDADTAAVLLRDHLLTVAEDDPGQSESLIEVANNIMEQADRVNKLKAEGYAPLSRFGQYSVDVVVDGKREYFDLFETKEAANQMAAKMRMEFGIGKVQTGTISAKEFQLFQGMTPESMELFGNMLGLDAGGENASDTVFQTYLRFTKNNRSAMKRLMHRKGIAGFSTDTGRVLASFIYSNARLTSSGLHMGTMDKAVQDIPKGQGQLKDAAIELREYIKNPREEAQAMRGLLFAQYLGGNVASMLMNFMQVPTVSLPYLSQFGGVKKATAALLQAMKDQKSDTLEKGLQQALKNADEKGITQPQALHELMAQSRGAATLKSGDGTKMGDAKALANNAMSKFSMGWGKLFGMAEQINRRSTFIAAYRLGIEKGVANPATFAENAVNETQFINNKANKAKFARGAIGGTLMTFKSYSTNYLELLYRLSTKNGPEGKKAALLMLGMLFLMAGAGGMPGAEDAEDLIDGIAQRMGYNLSTKKAKEKFLEEIFGKAIGSFILHGVSGLPGSPIDISGRAGFGNLIPGTGVFMPKASHANDLLEFGGPAAGMLKRFGEAVGHLSTGNVFEAAMAASPVAIANMRKGVDMLDSGMYKDAKGYKVMDTTTGEALAKIAGFQPKAVKDDSEDSYLRLRTKNFYNEYKQAVSARWANGLFENDADQVQEAKDMIASWNEKNPELPMRTNMFAIAQRLKHMKENRETRVLKSSPKVMQSTIRQEIAAEKAAQ